MIFHISLRGKSRRLSRISLIEKKSMIIEFFRGKEKLIIINNRISLSLTVNRGKEGGLKRCPPSSLPLSVDKRVFTKQAILHIKGVKWNG